jgi:hypothetical protein
MTAEETIRSASEASRKGTPKADPVAEKRVWESKAEPVAEEKARVQAKGPDGPGRKHASWRNDALNRNWLKALFLMFTLSLIGVVISIVTGSSIPLWLLFGFSTIFSIEKWFNYQTRKYKGIGKLYRLLLNSCILLLFGLLIWSGIKLFSQQFVYNPLVGSLIFLAEFVFFIWMWRVVAKNSWRWPSMKLTVSSLIALSVVLAFAGVQPISTYKDTALTKIGSAFSGIGSGNQQEVINPIILATPVQPTPPIVATQPTLKDPTWSELLDFLQADDTDTHPYVYPTFVCENFAEMLQNHAKKAGWRCAIVTVQLSGYPDFYHYGIPSNTGHALNAFQTTDRGLVYVDDTRAQGGPANQDNTVDVEIGKQYVPMALFPDPNWLPNSEPMGIVVSIGDPRW